jgi:hypothetical protein
MVGVSVIKKGDKAKGNQICNRATLMHSKTWQFRKFEIVTIKYQGGRCSFNLFYLL